MENILEMLKTDTFLLILTGIVLLLIIGFTIVIAKFSSINKKYKTLMNKLGNGKNIDEVLEKYMDRVSSVEKQNAEIIQYVTNLDKDMEKCIQKIGIVRYSAFKDTGSDLSFALAMLDENNDGVVFNGIYSREMSNIYAKPVKKGKSNYTISEEEQEAIDKAIGNDNIYKMR